jgi:uncharacterized RDD family membrane protein YckC
MAPPPYTPGPAGAPAVYARYAGFWMRLVGALIDGIVVGAISFVASIPFGILDYARLAGSGSTTTPVSTSHPGANLVGLVIGLAYTVGTMVYWQATPGMRVLNLRITDLNGQPIGVGRAVGRYFAAYLSACLCLIGFLIQPFTPRRQTLHDLLAGTVVLQD